MNDLRQRYDFLFDGTGDLTQETLLLYVFGPLETEARQAVEQHLADCEMCRDAAEGMALLGTKEQALALLAAADAKLLERLETLKQKVTRDGKEELIQQAEPVSTKPERKERRIGWYRYAAAASVVLVVGVAFWLVNRSLEGDMASNIAQVYEDSAKLESEMNRQDQKVASETAATDSLPTIVSGGTAPYAFEFADTTSHRITHIGEGFATGTYTNTAQDENGSVASNMGSAQKPAKTEDEFKNNISNDYEIEDLVLLEENSVADKYKSDVAVSKEKKKNEDTAAGNAAKAPTVTATAPTTVNKGSNLFDNNLTLNNVAISDLAIVQAQYPGGSAAIQQYFDQIQYPAPIAKGYRGVITFEVNFDKKGKITKAAILSGLGEPFDKLLLDHLKKMPTWTPPQPNGKPVESTAILAVEVTVR